MAKKKRIAREKTEDVDFLKPIDITKIGSDDDPCFGKEYDLSSDECKRCGDSELCAVVFSQTKAKELRGSEESKNRFKDMELDEPKENQALAKWVEQKKKDGKKRSEIIKEARRTFGSTRDEIKAIWKKLK